MRRRLALAVVLVAGFGLAVTASSGKPAAPMETPVQVTFTDGSDYAIRSDGRAYVNGIGGVRAVFVPAGNVVLDLRKSLPARTLLLDFTGPCTGDGCALGLPFVTVTVKAFMSTTYCQPFLAMQPGDFQECNLNVNFVAEGLGWFIRSGEDWYTDPVIVRRDSETSWTIEAAGDGVAKLLSYPTKGRMVLTDRGNYVMPVHLTVTLLP